MKDILAVDVGTKALKMDVFGPDLEKKAETSRDCQINLYGHGRADLEPEKWWEALEDCCAGFEPLLSSMTSPKSSTALQKLE